MGSGGGGSSGKVSYPGYMEDYHHHFLELLEPVIATAILDAPYDTAVVYSPDINLDNMGIVVDSYDTFLDGFVDAVAIGAQVSDQAEIIVSQWSDHLGPKFKAGMRDINAVMTSSFALGEALAVVRLFTEANLAGIDLRSKLYASKAEGKKWVAQTRADIERIRIIAKNEEEARQTELDVGAAKWPLEVWTYGAQMVGAGAGSGRAMTPGPTKAATALGGALSGAATGAMIGTGSGTPGVGTAVGAVVGGVAGLIMGMM